MIKKFNEYIKENNDFSNIIEYSILNPDLETDAIEKLVNDALDRNVKILDILPEYLNDVKIFINRKPIKISVAVDFPDGKSSYKENLKTINELIVANVDEIELTIDYTIFNLKEDKYKNKLEKLKENLEIFSNLCHKNSIVFKVILNINSISLNKLKDVAELLVETGIDYIQTSTAEYTDIKKVKYLKSILPDWIKIKVAGQISSIDNINQFKGYADRIGTSRLFI